MAARRLPAVGIHGLVDLVTDFQAGAAGTLTYRFRGVAYRAGGESFELVAGPGN